MGLNSVITTKIKQAIQYYITGILFSGNKVHNKKLTWYVSKEGMVLQAIESRLFLNSHSLSIFSLYIVNASS
jgi:hypothetical protein